MTARECLTTMTARETEMRQDAAALAELTGASAQLYSDYRRYWGMTPAEAYQTIVDIRVGRKSSDYMPTIGGQS